MTKNQIEEICEKFNVKDYTINDDMSIDVSGNINFSYHGLIELPLNFNIVTGDFYCNGNNLTNLDGCPKEVGGDLSFARNELTNLKGCAKKVGGDFFCSRNKLTSLEGGPIEALNYYCMDNQLTDLKGSPTKVEQYFECDRNKTLTSLEGSPEYVGLDFFCRSCKLTDLKGSPKKVGNYFDCSNNRIYTLEGFDCEVGELFVCSKNPLESIFNEVENDFIQAFKTFRVISSKEEKEYNRKIRIVNLKRLKYAMSFYNMPINLEEVKHFYKII